MYENMYENATFKFTYQEDLEYQVLRGDQVVLVVQVAITLKTDL